MALFAIQRAKYAFSHPILYAVGAAVFLALSIITMSNFIFGHYYFIYRDLTWPTDNRDLFANLFYSVDLESMRRTIYLGPIFAVVKLLGISSLDAEKLMFVLVRFLTGFLAFFSIYKFIQLRTRSENQPRKNSALFAIAIAGGFLYAYNPISTTMVAPTLGFAFAFAMIPPSFYFFDKSLQQRKSHDVIIASLFITLAIAGTIQYLVLLPVLLLVPWFAFSAVISAKRGLLKQTVMTFSQIVALIIVFSLYWILPAIISNLGGVPLEPQQYVVSTDFLNVVSQKLPLDKVIRLMGDWWPRIDNTPLFPVPAWNFLTFAIPVAMLSFVIFLRKSPIKFYVLLFVAIALWIAFFNKGTQPPFPSAYPSLFSIPLVGWMFRIPSKSAMILAFAATMAVSLGFYGVILQNRSSGIRKTLRLLLLPTFLVLVGILCWPMFTGDLGGVLADNKHQASAPIGPPNNILTTGLSDNNLAVVGGLDKLFLLEHVQNGNFSGRSILLLDQGVKTENILNFTNSVVVGTTPDDLLMHSIPANALVLSPFDYTNRYEPKQVFSLARTDYAINGSFPSSYLAKYSIHTQDLDFGKGLAFTRSDDTLDIPYSISQPGIYQVFVRTLESHQGGMMKIYSDKSLVKIIPTLARTDGFEWENLGAISYPSGKHVMSVESLRGINAINVIVLIPADNYQQMKQALAQRLANNTTQPVYELGVNDFTSKGSNIDQTILNPVKSDNSSNTYSGAIGIPKAASLMTLQLWVKPRSSSTSTSAVISDLSIAPTTTERILVHSHFESGGNVSEDFGYHPENLNVTIDSNAPLSGFKSLTARLSGSSNSNFGVLASGLVPLPTSHGFLSAGMFAATHDVDQLESQLVFYDHNRNPISQSTIFMTTADTQRTLFGKEIAVPENAAFVQLQFLSKMRPEPSSYYKLDVIILKQEFWDRPLSTEIFSESTPSEPRDTIQVGANDSAGLYIDNARDATPAWHLLESIPIDVTGDLQYRYGFHIDMRNVDSEFARFVYMSDPVQKATAASIENTSEPVLAIPKDTQISSSLGVLKSGNYTFGILAKACGINCTTRLGVNTGDSNASETIRLTGQSETYTWYYFSKYLPAGDTNLTITSTGGQALFQGIIVVPAGSKNLLSTFNSTSSASELVKGFAESSMNQDNQARIVSYQTNNPVSYHAIVNASKPFLLNLELPYGSMWRAYADGRTYSPEKIYSPGAGISSLVESAEFPATNGFLIDKTGQLGITVKFLPHDLFEDGLGITIAGLTASFGYILWSRLRTTRNSADNFSEYNQSADHYIGTQIGRMKERLGIWEIVGLGSLVSLVALSVLFSLGYDNDSVSNGTMTLVYFLLIASVGGQLASIFFRRNHHANGSSSKQR